MEIIVGRQGNQRVQITDMSVSRKHCQITPLGNDKYRIKNLSAGGTYVNGNEIVETTVTADTYIRLGTSYTVKVKDLLPVAETPRSNPSAGIVQPGNTNPPTEVPEYSIRPLQDVWNRYHNKLLEIQDSQRSVGLLRSASPLFTLGSGSISMFSRSLGLGDSIMYITGALTFIGLIIMVYSFYKAYNDDSVEQRERATDEFQNKYVCPNPKCHRFMGNQPYNILRQNKTCPYCKCKFTEK